LDGFPGAEVVIGFAEERGVVQAKMAKLFGIIDLLLGLEAFQFDDLFFELAERLFKFEDVAGAVAAAGTGKRN
jgi:hypothetical protein